MNNIVEEIKSLKTQIFALKSEPQIDYINSFPKTWSRIDIERYCMERDMEWQFYSSGQSAVGIKTTHEEYIEFCKYHAPTPENLARREKERAELEKEKNARKS